MKEDKIRHISPPFKEMVSQTNNISNEIKKLIGTIEIENVVGSFSQDKDRLLSLYQLRYRILTSQGIYRKSWAIVLANIADDQEYDRLTLTCLRIDTCIYLIFSDDDFEKCFGVMHMD
jgi:hypothetical protein